MELPETTDVKTRANLSYLWSVAAILMLAYILYMWGDKTEILTLVIGLIGGTIIGSIFGVYFGGATATKKNEPPTIAQTGENSVTNVNPPPEK